MTEKKFSLTEVLEGMSAEDQMEFITSRLNPQARAAFEAQKRDTTLRESYQKEMDALNTSKMGNYERIKRVTAIKEKYRARGLEVY